MAGFRLAPKAARARRNPWQRRRLVPTQSSLVQRTANDGFTITDGQFYSFGGYYVVPFTLSTSRTATDGFTFGDVAAGANPSAGTATGGLIFLFSQGTTGSSYTRSASDGFTISDSVGRVVSPVATNSYSLSATDGFVVGDVASGSVVALGAAATLVAVEFEFTALLDVELSFVGE